MGELLDQLPYICLADQEIWRTMSPLICFEIVEWHRPERVLRQFGMQQEIPRACSYEQQLHAVDARGRMDKNFGFFGRYFAEILFFGEPRKEKCTEISFVRFFPKISDFSRKYRYFSDKYRYFSEIFRYFHSFFLLLFCFKNLKKLFLVGFKPTQNA